MRIHTTSILATPSRFRVRCMKAKNKRIAWKITEKRKKESFWMILSFDEGNTVFHSFHRTRRSRHPIWMRGCFGVSSSWFFIVRYRLSCTDPYFYINRQWLVQNVRTINGSSWPEDFAKNFLWSVFDNISFHLNISPEIFFEIQQAYEIFISRHLQTP